MLTLFSCLRDWFRGRAALQAEILTLRHQLLVLKRLSRGQKPRLGWADRVLFVWLSQLWGGGIYSLRSRINRDMPIGPRMIFNATGIKKLEGGGLTSDPLMKALACGYEVILTAMRADEIISTKSRVRGDTLLPPFFAATILAARKLVALDLH